IMIQTVNPATGTIEKTFKPHAPEEIEQKLEQASRACEMSKKTAIKKRIALIEKLVEHLQENKETYAKLATLEMGRPFKESVSEIEKSIALCNFYIQNGETFLQEEHIPTEASKSYIQYDPLGVILGVMPWNYP